MKSTSFPNPQEMKSLAPFINRVKDKNIRQLKHDGLMWTRTSWENHLDYEVYWLGMPIIQNPYDILLMQELVYQIKPDLIIETGVAHGGSLIFYSSLLELMAIDNGKVIGIDIEIRQHNRTLLEKHPLFKRITLIEGSSTDPKTVALVKPFANKAKTVMVILDSNHTRDHVYQELRAYQDLITPGSYLVVFDTFMPQLQGLKGAQSDFNKNTAWHATQTFLETYQNFEVDHYFDKFFVSSCPSGFLRKKK